MRRISLQINHLHRHAKGRAQQNQWLRPIREVERKKPFAWGSNELKSHILLPSHNPLVLDTTYLRLHPMVWLTLALQPTIKARLDRSRTGPEAEHGRRNAGRGAEIPIAARRPSRCARPVSRDLPMAGKSMESLGDRRMIQLSVEFAFAIIAYTPLWEIDNRGFLRCCDSTGIYIGVRNQDVVARLDSAARL
jgi:hypothetical protein